MTQGKAGVRLAALAAVLAVIATGCGVLRPIRLDENPMERMTAAPLNLYTVDWWKELVTTKAVLEYAPREGAQPAVEPQSLRIATVTRDGYIRCFNAVGALEWSYHTRGPFFSAGAFHQGTLYVPGGDGVLYAFEAETGKLLWKYEAGEELVSGVAFTAKNVLVTSQTNTLFAVDSATGKWAWQYRRDMPSGYSIHGAATPVVRADAVYAGFADGHLVAIGATDGTLRWDRELSTGSQFVDVDSTPAFDKEGNLYAASYKNGLYALESATGATLWHVDVPGITGLTFADGILISSGDERISGYSTARGVQLWTKDVGHRAAYPSIVVGRYVLVPTAKSLLFLNASTGKQLQSFDPGKGITATPAVVGPHVYVLSNEGFLYAFRMNARG